MFYGGGMWGYFSQSCLDGLFNRQNFTIEDLLDEENIINDVKMNQNKFADFMVKNPQHLKSLVTYTITLPTEDQDEKHKHKYPFIASELLGIQIPKIQEFFFTTKQEEEKASVVEVENQTPVSAQDNVPQQGEQQQKEEEKPLAAQELQNKEKHVAPEVEQTQSEQVEVSETKKDSQQEQKPEGETTGNQVVVEQKDEKEAEKKEETAEESSKPIEQLQVNVPEVEKAEEKLEKVDEAATEAKNTTENDASNKDKPIESVPAQDPTTVVSVYQDPVSMITPVGGRDSEPAATFHAENKVIALSAAAEAAGQESSQKEEEWSSSESDNESVGGKHELVGSDLLAQVFTFITPKDTELNSTSAGYFSKVILNLVSGKEPNLLKYLQNNKNIIDDLIRHFYLKSISKIVLSLVTQDGIDLENDQFIDVRISIVEKLHELFSTSTDHEVLLNIQDVLVAINSASLKPQNYDVKRNLFSHPHIDILINSITQHKESFSQAALSLSSYLDYYRQTLFNDIPNEDNEMGFNDGFNFGRKNDETITKEFPLAYLQSKTGELIVALMEDKLNKEVPKHETQYGSLVQPFGLNRVKLLHLILCLLKTESQAVNDALVDNHFFTYLLELVKKHEWNNILHNQIEQVFTESFKIAVHNTKVREAIISEAKFLQFIAENGQDLQVTPGSSKKAINKGYVCLLVNFAQQIENQKQQFNWLQEAVTETPEWQEFIEGSYKKVNDLHSRDLGNEDPRKRKESADSMPNNDISIKEIYMKFISMYQSGNKVDDEEANPNDDSEGDEDTNEATEQQHNEAAHSNDKEESAENSQGQEEFRNREKDVIESENKDIEKEDAEIQENAASESVVAEYQGVDKTNSVQETVAETVTNDQTEESLKDEEKITTTTEPTVPSSQPAEVSASATSPAAGVSESESNEQADPTVDNTAKLLEKNPDSLNFFKQEVAEEAQEQQNPSDEI